jgi:hypothetical protein
MKAICEDLWLHLYYPIKKNYNLDKNNMFIFSFNHKKIWRKLKRAKRTLYFSHDHDRVDSCKADKELKGISSIKTIKI